MRPLFLAWWTPVPGVVASDATPVPGVVASDVTPVSGVVPSVKMAVVVAPIAPYDFVPGTERTAQLGSQAYPMAT